MVTEDQVRETMRGLFRHTPYDFQVKAVMAQLEGRSVILRAPTGAGKTDVALAPSLLARSLEIAFPRQMIYTVPMSVLATQFEQKTCEVLQKAREAGTWKLPEPKLAVQNGERPEDPRLESDLVFTTIDQALASYLNIPCGLPGRFGNLNAGAIATAHLIADEFHLFDPGAALPTTIDMLRTFAGAAPFLLMTATCSDALFAFLASELKAAVVEPTAGELQDMRSQKKTRVFEQAGAPLTATAVLARHHRLSIVVCNTVERAQDLYAEVSSRAPAGVEVRLLHSRFLRADRRKVENWCRRTFAEGAESTTEKGAILIATQVIEVGLDISCDVLHTELAPASSIVQRAGRCARFPGEDGRVIVYELPERSDGSPNYAPYLDEPIRSVTIATGPALETLCGGPVSYTDELMFVERAHGDTDADLCDSIGSGRQMRHKAVLETIRFVDRSRASELIRESDSRTLLVLSEPESCGNPYNREGFGFQTGSLVGRVASLFRNPASGVPWRIKVPVEREDVQEWGEVSYRWEELTDANRLRGFSLAAVNPALVHYDENSGFRFRPGAACESPVIPSTGQERGSARYHLTPYADHILGLVRAYEAKQDRLGIATILIARACHIDPETVDRLVRASLALHDAGKLADGWVRWATAWEQRLGKLAVGEPLAALVSHTDYDGASRRDRDLQRLIKPGRPPHAAEGALIVRRVAERLAGGRRDLWMPTLSAIARHHSPTISENRVFALDRRALPALNQALDVAGLPPCSAEELIGGSQSGAVVAPRWESPAQLLLYFFIVRTLRLCDQESFSELARLHVSAEA